MKTDICTSLIISRLDLIWVNLSDESCTENQNTHFGFSNFILFFENRAVCEKMWKSIVERGWPQMTVWRMRITCRETKAKHTLRICNTYCSSTVIMIVGTCIFVTVVPTLPLSSSLK